MNNENCKNIYEAIIKSNKKILSILDEDHVDYFYNPSDQAVKDEECFNIERAIFDILDENIKVKDKLYINISSYSDKLNEKEYIEQLNSEFYKKYNSFRKFYKDMIIIVTQPHWAEVIMNCPEDFIFNLFL